MIIAAALAVLFWPKGDKTPAPSADPTQPAEAPVNSGTDEENPYAEYDADEGNYKPVDEKDRVQVDNLSVYEGLDETWRNILLLGIDSRDFNTQARSDTMIIASINTKTGAVKMSSILRDTWVNIPGVHEERINVSYQFGGPELAIKTVNEMMNMNITEYVVVNFSSLPHLIDAIGGVEINVKNKEVEQINYGVGSSIWHGQKLGLDESDLKNDTLPEDTDGYVTLTGRQALAYARIRKIDSDLIRASRQRAVISAAMLKFRGETDTMKLLNMASSLLGYVKTNIDVMAMVSLAAPVLKDNVRNISEKRFPVDDSYTYETRNGQSAFYDLDLEANRQALHEFIYGD